MVVVVAIQAKVRYKFNIFSWIENGMQQILNLQLVRNKTFANFDEQSNLGLIARLSDMAIGAPDIFIAGSSAGSGVSHILQATCNYYSAQGRTASYLPLQQLHEEGLEFAGLESANCLAIDDVDYLGEAGHDLQTKIFGLYEAAVAMVPRTCRFIWGANVNAARFENIIPDLRSRMKLAYQWQLVGAGDESLGKIFLERAGERGLKISNQLRDYILQRARRDLVTLLAWLDRLDSEQIRQQSPITYKLVKALIEDS